MTERYLFGNGPFEGWTSLYPQIRQDLYFVMDDSWDIPADRNERSLTLYAAEADSNCTLPNACESEVAPYVPDASSMC